MRVFHSLQQLLVKVYLPIKTNGLFFASMYILGVLCAILTLPDQKGAKLYDNLFLELFLDLYVVSLVLTLFTRRFRLWVRRVIYVVLYVVAIADVYCFWKFGSTLTPTMLLLVGETDSREAGEFLRSYISPEVLLSPVGAIFLLMLAHIVVAWKREWLLKHVKPLTPKWRVATGCITLALLTASIITSFHNKVATWQLMSGRTIGEVEHTLTDHDHAILYTPFMRLCFSYYANELAAKQIGQLIETSHKARVDSCSYRSPNIVLIIGESYGKAHSQQYGYFQPTTPRQLALEKKGLLVKFSDVVAPWNLTSYVFKNVFSMHVVGQKGEWCDYPLFTQLFRKAGYHVTFLTNQFLPQAREALYDFSGGFFLNNPTLNKEQFDTRNTSLHRYDEGLLEDYDRLKDRLTDHNLIIFHLIGQHVSYKQRFPRNRMKFYASDYDDARPELTGSQKKMLSYYDNACLYNDSIVDQICKRFSNEDAIVIYMPDHGEECYEGTRGIVCRNHSANVDYPLAKYEFEIPFWIYCSHTYAVRHPEIFKAIVESKDKRFMTDALPHLLVYLAGISTPSYNAKYNIISPDYDELRPRILKGVADYDKLREEAQHE